MTEPPKDEVTDSERALQIQDEFKNAGASGFNALFRERYGELMEMLKRGEEYDSDHAYLARQRHQRNEEGDIPDPRAGG